MFDSLASIVFWSCAALLAYAYVLYPIGLWLVAKLRAQPVQRGGSRPTTASVILAVRNESSNLRRRLTELTEMVSRSLTQGEVIVVSDGSTDDTPQIAAEFAEAGVRLVDWDVNRGKAAALSYAATLAQYEVLVLADGRQRWAPDAMDRMLENFADPRVGGVSGELVLETCPGVLAGVGLYWRFEKWLRSQESAIHSQIGVTGAIAAVRRSLFRPVPAQTILDDVYWPMQVVAQGYRIVHDRRAIVYDSLPISAAGEMQRKVRTLVGNFQLVSVAPSLLIPWRNPIWLSFVSHKMLRLVAPWAMLGTLVSSAVADGLIYRAAFAAQLAFLALGAWGLTTVSGGNRRIPAAAGSFLMLHVAAWLAFWSWATGRSSRVWRRSQFAATPLEGANSP